MLTDVLFVYRRIEIVYSIDINNTKDSIVVHSMLVLAIRSTIARNFPAFALEKLACVKLRLTYAN
jgi:hypothetical protein